MLQQCVFLLKLLYRILLIDLVTLHALTEIKTKRTFPNFWLKSTWTNISNILHPWPKSRAESLVKLNCLSKNVFFVLKRCQVCRRLHHSEWKSSYFGDVANVLEDQSYQIGFPIKFFGNFANNLSSKSETWFVNSSSLTQISELNH